MTSDLGSLLADARSRLSQSVEEPHLAGLQAQVLLGFVLGHSRAWVLAHPEVEISLPQKEEFEGLLQRLETGEPLPYLTGKQEFFGLEFEVSPAVLIPRPETELLVETAIEWLKVHPERRRAADVGTGSGCIAVSIGAHVPDICLLAADRSAAALEVARRNAHRLAPNACLTFHLGDLLTAIQGPFDLVCANLPYIPCHKLPELRVTQYEPRLALDGGPDGLDAIRQLLQDAPRWLAPGGMILLEIEAEQGSSAAQTARICLPGAKVQVMQDLAGLDRLVVVECEKVE